MILFRPQDWPIAVKLLLAFLFVALVPLLIAGFLSTNRARDGLLVEAKRNLENTSRRTSQVLDDFLKARITDMQQTATLDQVVRYVDKTNNNRSVLGPNDTDQLTTFSVLKSKAGSLSTVGDYIFVVSKNGQVEITSNNNPNQEGSPLENELSDVSAKGYFQEAIKGRTYISDPVLISFQDRGVVSYFYVSSPVRDVRGQPVGAVVLRINLDAVWNLVNADAEAAGKNSYTMLIDDTDNLGIRLADSRTAQRADAQTTYLFSVMRAIPAANQSSWTNTGRFPAQFDFGKASNFGTTLPSLVDVLDRPTFDRTNPFFTTAFNDSGTQVPAQAAYFPVPSKPRWSYFVVVPEATYAAAANDISFTLIIVILVAVIAVILLALLLARLLTTPVRRISRVLGRIGIGDFDARVPVTSRDELGRLGESLNAMFDNTLNLIQSREEKEELQTRITTLLEEISTVAEGDLTVQAEVTADITGAIADSFNLMIEELRKTVLNIQNATGQTSAYLEQTVLNFQQLDKVSDRQANRVITATSSMGDINNSIQQVSSSAESAADVAQEARQNAHQGGIAVSQSISSMNRIRGNVQETAKKIKRLGESSQQIGEIVKLIDDIADQTNMLALNAAIQAAMAGEQGKGFSVVSEEVRRLAERSANATREIATLVKSIQDDTAEAVIAMEESTREVVDGSKVADEAGRALTAIESVVERLATLITNISEVTSRQATSSSDVARTMNELSSLTQEASNLRRQSSEAVTEVARTADDLRVSVSAFRVLRAPGQPAMPALGEAEDYFREVETYNMPKFDHDGQPVARDSQTTSDHYQNGAAASYPTEYSQPPNYQPNLDYAPPIYQPGEAYQPPAGDGGGGDTSYSPPRPAAAPVVAAASSSPALNYSPATQNPPPNSADPMDFDLNSLLNDDSVFDSLFDSSPRPAQPPRRDDESDKKRPQALG